MKRLMLAAFLATALPVASEEPARPPGLGALEDEVTGIVDRARPSLVQVTSHYKLGEHDDKLTRFLWESQYSGVVISGDGCVVTVATAVRGAKSVEVILDDGTMFPAKVLGVDDATNLAVVKIEPGDVKLAPMAFGDSDRVKAGNVVIALGNPFGLEDSVSWGLVAGTRRTAGSGTAVASGLIQLTAPVNPGDAGGLALNSRGELIGILSSTLQRAAAIDDFDQMVQESLQSMDVEELLAKLKKKEQEGEVLPKDLQEMIAKMLEETQKQRSKARMKGIWGSQQLGAEGINFAIPSKLVKTVCDQLIATGKVSRGFLGVQVSPVDPALRAELKLPKGLGVEVASVTKGSPASLAGIQEGDVILSLDGADVRDIQSLMEAVLERSHGETVKIRLVRDGKETEVETTLQKK